MILDKYTMNHRGFFYSYLGSWSDKGALANILYCGDEGNYYRWFYCVAYYQWKSFSCYKEFEEHIKKV